MKHKFVLAASIILGVVTSLSTVNADEPIGKREFLKNCAVCHGSDGKGNGPMVDFLNQAPSDLTQIRKRNKDQFPIQQVYDTVVDVERVRAHGKRDMPIWGERYAREMIEREGEFGSTTGGSSVTQARVLELAFYLATIQE